MSGLELRHPALLALTLLAIPVFLLSYRAGGRVLYSSLAILPARGASWRTALAWLPAALLALATIGMAIALAGPRQGTDTGRVRKQGIAIMMVVDRSSSMLAEDMSEGGQTRTRLDAVKDVFVDFVRPGGALPGRPNDAIGLVSFARYADSSSPLTIDHDNLLGALAQVEIVDPRREPGEDGTAIGDGLGLAVERLREAKPTSKVIVLLTDGVSNAGAETPLSAAELARTQSIKVYTVGVGTDGVAQVTVDTPFGPRKQLMEVEIDEETLTAIAERTGGRYFRATDAEALRQVYQDIDALERTEITEEKFLEYNELYGYPLAAGLLCACLGWLLGGTLLRRLP